MSELKEMMLGTTNENVCIFCLVDCNETPYVNRFGCDCKVIYHDECMDDWVKVNNVCPICKNNFIIVTPANIVEELSNDQIIRRIDAKMDAVIIIFGSLIMIISIIILIFWNIQLSNLNDNDNNITIINKLSFT